MGERDGTRVLEFFASTMCETYIRILSLSTFAHVLRAQERERERQKGRKVTLLNFSFSGKSTMFGATGRKAWPCCAM